MVEVKFIADCMLGKLSKWMKILGFDTEYHRVISDDELLEKAIREKRILLTRDRNLVKRKKLKEYILIESEVPIEQVKQILKDRRLKLDESNLLSRCLICNVRIKPIRREEVRDLVPPYVYRTQKDFSRCPECERIYWGATHRDNILLKLKEKLNIISLLFLFFGSSASFLTFLSFLFLIFSFYLMPVPTFSFPCTPAAMPDELAYLKHLRNAGIHAEAQEWDNEEPFFHI
ncbi:MAG: Mut7-C RNAse domain-containing protein [Acidobacteriota bacterium]